MVVNEQDIDARFDIAVLVCVVEKDDIGVPCGLVGGQPGYAFAAILVHCDIDMGKFVFHLVRLVPNEAHRGVVLGQQIAVALALIAPAKHRHLSLVLEQSDEILDMWGLARAAHSDVAHRDDRHGEAP